MDLKFLVALVIVPFIQAQPTRGPIVSSGAPTTASSATIAPDYPDGVRCSKGTDCPVNMCCVHNPLSRPPAPSRKRFLFTEFSQHDHGYCRYERKQNESCFPLGHDPSNPSLYEFFCPCLQGLECRGQQVHETQHSLTHVRPMCQTLEN